MALDLDQFVLSPHLSDRLRRLVNQETPRLIVDRRAFHHIPELGWQETPPPPPLSKT